LEPELTELVLQPTGHICADCGDKLTYTSEAWLLQVATLQQIGGHLQSFPLVDEADPNRDFLFTPYFFCFECWENQYDELKEEFEDQPPVTDAGGVAECACCGSSVLEGEYCGLFQIGEFQASNRAPNGVAGPRFEMPHPPDVLCLYCLAVLNESFISMWDELSQFGECQDCIFSRCWRAGACPCSCHLESELVEDAQNVIQSQTER
jgi:hypothetical protein